MTNYRKSLPEGTASHTRAIIEETKDQNVLRRAQAIYCRAAYDMPLADIAALTGFSQTTVKRLHSDFLRTGMEIFNLCGRGGRRRQIMSPEEENAFLQSFVDSGHNGSILEVSRIHEALNERAGRSVHLSAVYKLLHRHGWRKLVPRPRHPKGDEAAQAAFKKMA